MRIIILNERVVLQKDPITRLGKEVHFDQVELALDEAADPALIAQIAALRALVGPAFEARQKPLREEIFLIEEPVGVHPQDNNLHLTACCGLPVPTNHTTVLLSVVIKHHKDGEYLQTHDKLVELIADNTTQVPVVKATLEVVTDPELVAAGLTDNTVAIMGEFDWLLACISAGAPLFPLTRRILQLRKGRFY